MISVPSTGGVSVGISVFANRGTADFHPGFDSLDVGIEPMHNICDIITPPLFQLLTFAVFPVGVLVGKVVGLLRVADVRLVLSDG